MDKEKERAATPKAQPADKDERFDAFDETGKFEEPDGTVEDNATEEEPLEQDSEPDLPEDLAKWKDDYNKGMQANLREIATIRKDLEREKAELAAMRNQSQPIDQDFDVSNLPFDDEDSKTLLDIPLVKAIVQQNMKLNQRLERLSGGVEPVVKDKAFGRIDSMFKAGLKESGFAPESIPEDLREMAIDAARNVKTKEEANWIVNGLVGQYVRSGGAKKRPSGNQAESESMPLERSGNRVAPSNSRRVMLTPAQRRVLNGFNADLSEEDRISEKEWFERSNRVSANTSKKRM
jgi:hypothetical protein